MSKNKDQFNVTEIAESDNISCSIQSLMLPCRDGIRLHTVIYFPLNLRKKAPVILRRSPYCQKTSIIPPDGWALKNAVVSIMQSCRGTGWSEGVFDPAERDAEKNDAEDLFLWLRKQDWFNGRCVMNGASYPGWVQWCAERSGCPELVGTAPRVAPFYSCCGAAVPGGGARLSFTDNWMLSMHHRCHFGWDSVPNYEGNGIFRHLPVIEADGFHALGIITPDGMAAPDCKNAMRILPGTTTAPVDLAALLGKGHHCVAVKSFYRHQPFYNFVMVKLITDSGEHTLEFRNQLESDRSQITFELEIR